MDKETIAMIADLSQLMIGVAALIASIAIPWAIHRRSILQGKIQFDKEVKDLWMTFDEIALSDPTLTRLADNFMAPEDAHLSDEERREKWLFYMYLNIASISYSGTKRGLTLWNEGDAMKLMEDHLKGLLVQDRYYDLVRKGYFKKGETVVFLHTGGAVGLFGYTAAFDEDAPGQAA